MRLPRDPGLQLLFHCLRSRPEPASILSLASRVRDWTSLTTRACQLRIDPLLYRVVESAGARQHVWADSWDVLAERSRLYAEIAEVRLQHLGEVLEQMAAAGLRAVLLKGAAVANLVYSEPGLRVMADVDLLLERDELERAEAVLRELGYRPDPESPPREWYLEREHHHIVPYNSADGRLTLEIHHRLLRPGRGAMPAGDVIGRACLHRSAAFEALVPSAEDLLVHVSLHLADYGFGSGMRGLADISRIADVLGDRMSWPSVTDRVRETGEGDLVHAALRAARDLAAARIPATATTSLAGSSRLGRAEFRLLDALIPLAVVSAPRMGWPPPWLLVEVVLSLFDNGSLSRKASALVRFVAGSFVDSARSRAEDDGRPLWRTLAGHPLYLLRRELARRSGAGSDARA